MKIRPYTKSDIEVLVELYNETTKKYLWNTFNEEQRKIILFSDLNQAHDFLNPNITLVLEVKDKILGFVMMRENGYINMLYIDKKYTNKGYGKKLITAIEDAARKIGLTEVYLYSSAYASSHQIYEKYGYTNKGLEKHTILGVEFEDYRMEKKI